MKIRTLKTLDLKNKRCLVRVDFNVPLKNGIITDDTRIKSALPTLKYILSQKGASLIIMSHLGRPKGQVKKEFSLDHVHGRLQELLGRKIIMANDCIGSEIKNMTLNLKEGEVLLLENLRFHKEETENNTDFSKQLADNGDVYINDAFGTAHRAHASTEGVSHFLPSAGGFLIEKEVNFFEPLVTNPEKPFVAIIGGAKVSSKIGVLESLLKNCTALIIGGGMAYTFLKAKGINIGNSLIEEDYIDTASQLMKTAVDKGVEIMLPVDHMVAHEFSDTAEAVYIKDVNIPDGFIGMDIGSETLKSYRDIISNSKSLVWNGPLGVFEFENFSKGTLEVAEMVASCKGTTVVGGGDSVAAVNKFGYTDRIDHVSTGGGASLEYLEGKTLPGIIALM
ncbi:MAG: phosphoglycerate kinase [Spirochaetaceae bacterium]|nr:phosphoglycerate kinase [Spirochaetaceae bacterium]